MSKLSDTLQHLSLEIINNHSGLTDFHNEVRVKDRGGKRLIYAEEDKEYPHWGKGGYFYIRYVDKDPEVRFQPVKDPLTCGHTREMVINFRLVAFVSIQNEDACEQLGNIIEQWRHEGSHASVKGWSANRDMVYKNETNKDYSGEVDPSNMRILAIDFVLVVPFICL